MSTHIPVRLLPAPRVIRNVGRVEDFAPLPDRDGRLPGGIAVLNRGEDYAAGLVYYDDERTGHWHLTNTHYDLTRDEAQDELRRQLVVWS